MVPRLGDGFLTAVNAAEVADKLIWLGETRDGTALMLRSLGFRIIAADTDLALEAAAIYPLTRRAGLSLGDRFCLALAKRLNLPALTGDRRWREVADDIGVKVELFR